MVAFPSHSPILFEGLQKDALLLGGFFNGRFLTTLDVQGLALIGRVNPPQILQNHINLPVRNLLNSLSFDALRPMEKVKESLFHLLFLLTYYKKSLSLKG